MLRAAFLAALLAIPAPAAAQSKPASAAEIDAMILEACLGEGGKAEECNCGLGIARRGLSERQFQIVPILWPIVKGEGDFASKFAAGATALGEAGYTIADGMALMLAVQANASRVEKECKRR